MNYTLILGILVAVAVVLAVIIIVALVVGAAKQKKLDYANEYDDEYDDDEYDGNDEYDDEEDEYDDSDEYEYDDEEDEYGDEEDEYDDEEDEEEYIPPRPVRKQWKLILEDLDTWEKRSIIFYDNIGIGRKRESDQFEKYYLIKEDPRASKLHCAIISRDGKLYLKDMGSRNGTYLNGEKLERPTILQKEDIIGVGETQIEIKKVMKEK